MSETITKIPLSACAGCEDDFYNGKNPYGIPECWNRESAKMTEKILIPIDLAPPYKNLNLESLPSCYRRKRHVAVKPEVLDSQGYWRS